MSGCDNARQAVEAAITALPAEHLAHLYEWQDAGCECPVHERLYDIAQLEHVVAR